MHLFNRTPPGDSVSFSSEIYTFKFLQYENAISELATKLIKIHYKGP